MRLLLTVLPAVLFAQLCEVEPGIGMGAGSITVHNDDGQTHEITISDTPECVIGYKSELHGNTTRQYDIAEEGSYFCVGGSGGVKVESGKNYEVRGGALGAR